METAPAWVSWLPGINASFNVTSTVLLITGYRFIRRRQIDAHRRCMLAAFTSTTLFLVGYLTLHYHIGATPFGHSGWVRATYLTILTTHTILAIINLPMAIVTLLRAWREDFVRHRALARWTLPIWLYVSVTGVIVYVMLYHVPGAAG